MKVDRQKLIALAEICKEGLQKLSARTVVVLTTHLSAEVLVVGRLECGRCPS